MGLREPVDRKAAAQSDQWCWRWRLTILYALPVQIFGSTRSDVACDCLNGRENY